MGTRKQSLHAVILDRRDELLQRLGSLKRYQGQDSERFTNAQAVSYNEAINDAMSLVREMI